MRRSDQKVYNLPKPIQSMKINDMSENIHRFCKVTRNKSPFSDYTDEPLLPVDGLYAIEGGYC